MEKKETLEKSIIALNTKANRAAKDLDYISAYNNLDQAIELLEVHDTRNKQKLLRVLYNNYGLISKQQGDFEKSLKFFKLSGDLCKEDPAKLADCYLNICSLYSKLSNHPKALEYSIKALNLLKASNSPELVVACQNIGAEYEYLGLKYEAMKIYQKGYMNAKEIFGNDHKIVNMFRERYMKLAGGEARTSVTPSPTFKNSKIRIKTTIGENSKNKLDNKFVQNYISMPICFKDLILETKSSPKVRNRNCDTPKSKKVHFSVESRKVSKTPTNFSTIAQLSRRKVGKTKAASERKLSPGRLRLGKSGAQALMKFAHPKY